MLGWVGLGFVRLEVKRLFKVRLVVKKLSKARLNVSLDVKLDLRLG